MGAGGQGEPHTGPLSVPGSYAHAVDGLYRVAREGKRSRPRVWRPKEPVGPGGC